MSSNLSQSEILKRVLSHHGQEMGERRVDHIVDRVTEGQEWCRIPDVPGIIDEKLPQCYEIKPGSDIVVYPLWTQEQQKAADIAIFRESGIAKRIREEHNAALLVRKSQYPGWSALFLSNCEEARRVVVAIVTNYGVPYDARTPKIFLGPKVKLVSNATKKRRLQMSTANRAVAVDSLDKASTEEDFVRLLDPLWDDTRRQNDPFMSNWIDYIHRPKWFNAHREKASIARPYE